MMPGFVEKPGSPFVGFSQLEQGISGVEILQEGSR